MGGDGIVSDNPAFWVYSIPYVNVHHLFEMPLLGYLGYLPFGVYCYATWLAYAYLTGIDMKKADIREL